MNKEDLIKKILKDNSIEYTKEDLELILEKELEKDYFERDYDLISEINQYLILLDGKETDIDIEDSINKIIYRSNEKKRSYYNLLRIPAVACMVAIIFFSANIISISAFNIDLFSEIVEFSGDIIKFDFSKKEEKIIELERTMDDPYGIKGELEKVGIESMVPTYIPEGFELVDLETDGIEDNNYNSLLLHYKKDKYILNINIVEYKDLISNNIGLVSEDNNLKKVEINNTDIYILLEDNRYNTIFSEELVVYNVSTNLEYELLIKILESFK